MQKGLTNNQLKLIALVAMTVDHIGVQFFPNEIAFRIIGRLAFPIFAYMIAEGCRYTKNRKRYFLIIFAEALVCQLVYLVAERSLYMSVFVTFTLSIALVYLADKALKDKNWKSYSLAVGYLIFIYLICEILPKRLSFTDFCVDYGFFGVLMPAVIYFARNDKQSKIFATACMCVLLGLSIDTTQYYGLLAVLPLALYNGERGKINLKYFFYIYYPLHLVAIYLISLFI